MSVLPEMALFTVSMAISNVNSAKRSSPQLMTYSVFPSVENEICSLTSSATLSPTRAFKMPSMVSSCTTVFSKLTSPVSASSNFILAVTDCNSYSASLRLTSIEYTPLKTISSRLQFMGALHSIVARIRLSRAMSSLSRIVSPSLPLISSLWAKTPSRLPYVVRRSLAVFSPTPLTPGILSDGSPRSAL